MSFMKISKNLIIPVDRKKIFFVFGIKSMFWRHFLFFATIHAYNVVFYQFHWIVLTIKQLIITIKLGFYQKIGVLGP